MDTDGYIGIMGTDGYNYLGIAEKDGICHEQVKELTRKEYFKRLTNLCKSNRIEGISSKQSTHGQSRY